MSEEKTDTIIEEIDKKLESLKAVDKLTSLEALEQATEIVKLITTIIEKGTDNVAKFYEMASGAYLIAAEKVPKEERDTVAFPSNFWSMRAKQEKNKSSLNPKPIEKGLGGKNIGQKARLRLSGTSPVTLDSICSQIRDIAVNTGVTICGPVPLPKRKLVVPSRKSPGDKGRAIWEPWEMRVHKRLVDLDADERALRNTMRIQVPKDFRYLDLAHEMPKISKEKDSKFKSEPKSQMKIDHKPKLCDGTSESISLNMLRQDKQVKNLCGLKVNKFC